ncbi:interleukin-1 beta-like [Cyclopterus lumpus]|nr:interleukin-1 beta-like [Cyclopterus lumpus]
MLQHDETVVTATQNWSTSVGRTFQRFNSEEVVTLCDFSQKDVVLAAGDLKLKAVILKGGSCERRVTFQLARYLNSGVSRGDGLVVVLSVTGSRHISCCMQGGRALLELEECSKQKLQNISDHEDMDRFLFFKRTVGFSLNTFESLKHPGWFISTSDQDQDESMEMCRVDDARRLISFKMI